MPDFIDPEIPRISPIFDVIRLLTMAFLDMITHVHSQKDSAQQSSVVVVVSVRGKSRLLMDLPSSCRDPCNLIFDVRKPEAI